MTCCLLFRVVLEYFCTHHGVSPCFEKFLLVTSQKNMPVLFLLGTSWNVFGPLWGMFSYTKNRERSNIFKWNFVGYLSFLKNLALAVVTAEVEHVTICICKYVYFYANWFMFIYLYFKLENVHYWRFVTH